MKADIYVKSDFKVQNKAHPSDKQQQPSKEDFFETRFNSLTNLFQDMNVKLTDFLPERDLLQLLDSLCVREFDREIARGLFAKIPKQMNPQKSYEKVIQVQDFIDTFIKAEYLLLMKSEEIEKKLADVSEQIEALNHQLEILKTKGGNVLAPIEGEEFNLNLEIVEVVSDDLEKKVPQYGRYTGVVKFDGYKYETLEVTNEGSEFNPVFEHTFHLKIPSLQDKFVLCLRKYEDPKRRAIFQESQAKFSFDLADQIRNEAWVELYDEQRRYTKEKMHVILELQTENTEGLNYFNDKLEKLEAFEEELLSEKDVIQSSLRDLVEPFSVRGRVSNSETPKGQTQTLKLNNVLPKDDGDYKDFGEEKEPQSRPVSIFANKPSLLEHYKKFLLPTESNDYP